MAIGQKPSSPLQLFPLPLQVGVESDSAKVSEAPLRGLPAPIQIPPVAAFPRFPIWQLFSPLASGSHMTTWSHNTRFVRHLWWRSVMQFDFTVYSESKLHHQTHGRCTVSGPCVTTLLHNNTVLHNKIHSDIDHTHPVSQLSIGSMGDECLDHFQVTIAGCKMKRSLWIL